MKKRYILFTYIFLFSISSFSQVERIDELNWMLHNIIINSENHINPLNAGGDQVSSNFGAISGVNQYFDTWFCDSTGIELVYDANNSSFSISSMGTTLGGCEPVSGINFVEINQVHNKFIGFFSDNSFFNYQIQEETIATPKTLIITAQNGDSLIYNLNVLSNSNIDQISPIKIHPNPVRDVLYINGNHKLKSHKIEVYDLFGKLYYLESSTQLKPINVENLSKGVYFLLIKDESGKTATKKFIKI